MNYYAVVCWHSKFISKLSMTGLGSIINKIEAQIKKYVCEQVSLLCVCILRCTVTIEHILKYVMKFCFNSTQILNILFHYDYMQTVLKINSKHNSWYA